MDLVQFCELVFKRNYKEPSFLAQVKEVDEEKGTCTVLVAEGPELYDVRLQSVVALVQSHIIVFPKIDSLVLCGRIGSSPTEAYVAQTSAIEKLSLRIGEQSLEITSEGFVFNGGSFKGAVKVEDLVKKLNALEEEMNSLKQKVSLWKPIPSDGGAALQVALASWSSSLMEKSTESELENEKVKH